MKASTLIIACMCMTLGLTLAMDYGSSYGSYDSYGSYGGSIGSSYGYGSYGFLPQPVQPSGGLGGGFLFLILFLFLFLILIQNGTLNNTSSNTPTVTLIG